ncbi:A-type potassium channel modulatory protein KCNIP1 [Procambarus clarkii]|uniref:A-type potassium channel modulatory protein KCNIP1 n=1 Tax=Procambarus clarkii TaxID=6728 RepID=UPI0037426D0B
MAWWVVVAGAGLRGVVVVGVVEVEPGPAAGGRPSTVVLEPPPLPPPVTATGAAAGRGLHAHSTGDCSPSSNRRGQASNSVQTPNWRSWSRSPRYRPEDINALSRTTHFTRAELQRLYRSFKDRCPTGVVREDAFKELYFQMFPKGASSSKYPHYVFNNLDKENTGVISFEDLITLLSRLSRGSLNDRLKWIFSLYDLNGDGCITRQEMTDVVQAVYDLMGKHTDTPVDEQTVGLKVESLFTTLDLNKDGVITLDEFTEACSQDSTIAYNIDAMLQCDVTVLNPSDITSSDAITPDHPPSRNLRR